MPVLPDEPTDEEKSEELEQDNGTPFRPAAPTPTNNSDIEGRVENNQELDDTHPVTDTNMQPEEQYEEGIAGAAEAHEPPPGSVKDVEKPNSQQM
jgi:hypothetical protein